MTKLRVMPSPTSVYCYLAPASFFKEVSSGCRSFKVHTSLVSGGRTLPPVAIVLSRGLATGVGCTEDAVRGPVRG